MRRVFLIDLDLTLIDSFKGLVEAVRYVASSRGFGEIFLRLDPERFLEIYYRDDFESLLPSRDLEFRWSFWESVWKRYVSNSPLRGKLFECAHSALAYLRGRGLVYVTTGREIRSCEMIHEILDLDLRDMIHGLYTVGDFGKYTKKRDLYKIILERSEEIGFREKDIVVISDSYRDLENAWGLGLDGVGFVSEKNFLVKELFEKKGFRYISSWCDHEDLVNKLLK